MGGSKLVGAVAAVGLAVGTLSAVSATASAAPTPESYQQQLYPDCLYKNNSGNRQPIKNRPRRGSHTDGWVRAGNSLWGPCKSTLDGGGYKACGPGKSHVWTRVYRDRGWVKTRCFKRLQ